MGMPSMPELLIILAIVVLLFGAKKIPELAKGMGSGIKNFKKAMKEDDDEEVKSASVETKGEKRVEQKGEAGESAKPEEKKEA
ncbi:twin-arginine translocation protein TatA [Hydrogenimonas sp.]|nr:twin-arginine translocation protein TatA [Hydrogenimonas sp.]